MDTTHVVLRRIKDAGGLRLLEASVTDEGDVRIEGYDLGDGVERALGVREYEWTWTIPAASVPDLLRALEASGNVLLALEAKFSGDNAALLDSFLEKHGIPTKRWSRLGD